VEVAGMLPVLTGSGVRLYADWQKFIITDNAVFMSRFCCT